MKTIKDYIFESLNSFLDRDTITEINELNMLSPDELKNVFNTLNYKEGSDEAAEHIAKLPSVVIDILKKYKYAVTEDKYYSGLRALFNRVKVENFVGQKLASSSDITNVKQVPHNIDRNDKYDFTSSVGNIDVKTHFYNNKNFTFAKSDIENEVDWYCFADIDLSNVSKFDKACNSAKIYLVNKKDFYDKINTKSPEQPELKDKGSYYLISLKTVKKYAKYIL